MAMIDRFEAIMAWPEARVLTRDIYAKTKREPFARDFGLRDHIQRASVSSTAKALIGDFKKSLLRSTPTPDP